MGCIRRLLLLNGHLSVDDPHEFGVSPENLSTIVRCTLSICATRTSWASAGIGAHQPRGGVERGNTVAALRIGQYLAGSASRALRASWAMRWFAAARRRRISGGAL
jgi:hypothetical protein